MAYKSNSDSGYAHSKCWMQIPSGTHDSITEGSEAAEISARNYAFLTYQVNASPITISGDVLVDAVGIDDSGTVKLSGDQLKVFDQEAIEAINNLSFSTPNYSKIIEVTGDFTYVMQAVIGSGTSGEAIWQVKRIYASGGETTIEWADGDDDFDNSASAYLSLAYSL